MIFRGSLFFLIVALPISAAGCGAIANDPRSNGSFRDPAARGSSGTPEALPSQSPLQATTAPVLPNDPDKTPRDDSPNNTGPK